MIKYLSSIYQSDWTNILFTCGDPLKGTVLQLLNIQFSVINPAWNIRCPLLPTIYRQQLPTNYSVTFRLHSLNQSQFWDCGVPGPAMVPCLYKDQSSLIQLLVRFSYHLDTPATALQFPSTLLLTALSFGFISKTSLLKFCFWGTRKAQELQGRVGICVCSQREKSTKIYLSSANGKQPLDATQRTPSALKALIELKLAIPCFCHTSFCSQHLTTEVQCALSLWKVIIR